MRPNQKQTSSFGKKAANYVIAVVTAATLMALAVGAEPSSLSFLDTLDQDFQSGAQDLFSGTEADAETRSSSRLFLERAELEAWTRETIGAAQEKGQLVGAAVAVIRPEGTIIAKGFGRADHKLRDPIHPSVTWLPAGELGNLLLAEMLVELEAKDRLDLDDPADDVLTRVSLPREYTHLSIRDLFGLKTGLTSTVRGTLLERHQRVAGDLSQIKAMLKRSSLERPGQTATSPLALALASLAAEDLSGQKIESALALLLSETYSVNAWFNTTQTTEPKYTSRHHRISPDGEIEIEDFHAVSQGFVASQGIYLTLDDMAQILVAQLKGLNERSRSTKRTVDLAFRSGPLVGSEDEQSGTFQIHRLGGNVSASSLAVLLVPELEIGLLAVVNSGPGPVGFAVGMGKEAIPPPVTASDISRDFLSRFVKVPENLASAGPNGGPGHANYFAATSGSLAGPDRVLEILGPLRRTSSVNALTALFLISGVLQFTLFAAARWPAESGGQKTAKWLGMASVITMTAALAFPIMLLALGHNRALIDPLYRTSQIAFPVAGLLALGTVLTCVIAWRKSFWGHENVGFRRRLCFTVGSTGVFGLAIVAWQLDLIMPGF